MYKEVSNGKDRERSSSNAIKYYYKHYSKIISRLKDNFRPKTDKYQN
jgi:hypothetical protein